MRETIDQGLGDLQSKQGHNGLPPAPPSAKSPAVQSAFVAEAPPTDPNVAAEIKQADTGGRPGGKGSCQRSTTSQPPKLANVRGASSVPVRISGGQTVDEVTAALGPPKSVVKLGTKEIYVYPDMKVTFRGGKVSDVQ